MKIYLNCYVWGGGYKVKCYDFATHRVSEGSSSLGRAERALFNRSGAEILLADMGTGHFGFVRQVPTPDKDENGRDCFLNFALSGESGEDPLVDRIIQLSAGCEEDFRELLRNMVVYDGPDYRLDWEQFERLKERAEAERIQNTRKKVRILRARPSVKYFLNNCEMGWKESDIARIV